MDKITIVDISAYGYHGVFEAERKLGQNFLVDLEVELDLREAGIKDNLDCTVNYVGLQKIVRNVVEGESCNLIESIAEKIALMVLEDIKIKRVMVKVKKNYIPEKDFTGKVSVEIIREQSH
jgi:dihydroneopterin aldolase